MSTLVNIAARFPDKGKFHSNRKVEARASLAQGSIPLGEEDDHSDESMSLRRATRTTSESDTSCRLASNRSQANNDGGRWISSRWTRCRFFGGAIVISIGAFILGVNRQLLGFSVNSPNEPEITGELKVRRGV